MTKRLAFFGGTFDPIHRGHLDVAQAAQHALRLDRVHFMPAAVPPHRAQPHASAAHRFAMTALAIHGHAGFVMSDLDMLATAPSYTVTTLDRIAQSGIDTHACVLILGADAFRDIRSWKAYPDFLDRCGFAVGALRDALPDLAERMSDAGNIHLVDAPTAPVSSTEIRRRVAGCLSIASMVPPAVAEYIESHGLYQETRSASS
jgi:nicotinate-nucleotide adenylyltransferase